ncbi:GntR family transcriptional regulator [Streptomyces albus subsp. albus]|nr:GntR family transcriptional regulator [Streptomyces albus subsp. albus]
MADLRQRNLIVVQERLRDQVADILRAAISSGELLPGTVHSAPVLAAGLGVSATPVRDAMLTLAREGMVEPVRNKGFRITEVSDRDLDEYLQLRELIEVPTIGRVTRLASVEDLESMRPVAQEIVAAAGRHDLTGYLDADRRFHLQLLGLAGNTRLVEVVGDLRKRSRLLGLADQDRSGRLMASAQEHLELLDLMIAGDAAGAERLMRRHLGDVRTLRDPQPGP